MFEFKRFEEIKDMNELISLVCLLEGCVSFGFMSEDDYEEFTTCLRRLLEIVEKEGE